MGLPYISFEPASGRSTCQICFKSIKKGDPSVKALIGSGYYPHVYDERCFLTSPNLRIEELVKKYLQTIPSGEMHILVGEMLEGEPEY